MVKAGTFRAPLVRAMTPLLESGAVMSPGPEISPLALFVRSAVPLTVSLLRFSVPLLDNGPPFNARGDPAKRSIVAPAVLVLVPVVLLRFSVPPAKVS